MQSGTSTRPLLFRLSLLLLLILPDCHGVQPQNADPRFHGQQKTREERWHQSFGTDATVAPSARAQNLVRLLQRIVNRYMGACVTVVAYDEHVERNVDDGHVLRTFLSEFQRPYMHGRITANYTLANRQLLQQQTKTAGDSSNNPSGSVCRNYVLFLSDVLRTRDVIGPQPDARVVIVPRSSQWKQQEFLASPLSADLVHLLIVGESLGSGTPSGVVQKLQQQHHHQQHQPAAQLLPDRPYVLYTHRLYTDGLGSNEPTVLTSWIRGQLSRPAIHLFPAKFRANGFAMHRFVVAAMHQPPYVIKRLVTDGTGTVQVRWDGLEVRILRVLAQRLNFTVEIVEPRGARNAKGPTFSVIDEVRSGRADFGLAGAYVTSDRLAQAAMSVQHSKDCAAFITLTSKALPRYRAIMGPFQWPVWLAIIATYLLAIFPLAFSDRLTLRHLLGNWSEVENMFWYVFGTFTNSLTFGGEFSWSATKRSSTRLLIGFYWVFTIIITACYTSSIIAFVTLPVFPETVDTMADLARGYYRFGTLFNDGWQSWFLNSTHAPTQRLVRNLELVADVQEGLNNVTKAFFWPYAFLGSRAQLEYIVEGNFSHQHLSRSTALHIGDECLSIYGVALLMPEHAVYAERINNGIQRLQQSGLVAKLWSELQTDLLREKRRLSGGTAALLRAPTAKQLRVDDATERGLTVADTEGMFLLMGIGYAIALALLLSEMVGGFTNRCRQVGRQRRAAEAESKRNRDDMDNGKDVAAAMAAGGLMPSVVVTMINDNCDEMGTNSDADSGRSNGVRMGGGGGNGLLFRRRTSVDQCHRGPPKTPPPEMLWMSEHRRNNSCSSSNSERSTNDVAKRFVAMRLRHSSLISTKPDVECAAKAAAAAVGDDAGYVGSIVERIPTPYATFEERFGEKVLHDDY